MKNIKEYIPQIIKNYGHIITKRKKKRGSLRFGIDLVKHCNLKCCCCDHFSCIADPEFADYDIVRRDLLRLRELFSGNVEQIKLLGGEPLLNEKICSYFELVRNIFPEANIILITNGTLLLKKNSEFWKSCKDNRIVLSITRYPINMDYDEVDSFIKKNGIKTYCNSNETLKSMYCVPIDVLGKQNARISYAMCRKGNDCITLENGKLFLCTLIPNIYIFNKKFGTNLVVTKDDFIDIYEAQTADEILEQLSKAAPFCRYCDNAHFRSGIRWGVTKGTIEEWT